MNSLFKSLLALLLPALLAACGTFQKNPALPQYQPDQGYRFELLEAGDNSDELFVIVTLSGGGTRAAALSYGVLEALRDTWISFDDRRIRLLDEVDVISSISGGSFPAAYYALNRERIFKDFPDKFLYRPIQSDLAGQAFSPGNWFKLGGSSYGRSDLAADFYDREVFGGATYASLVQQRQRPFVILNATDMTTGRLFSFTQDQFDLLCSDLGGVPLARAAASSSAFPGLLTPLTFQNYAGSCGYEQPEWVGLALKDHASRVNPRRTARAENRMTYTREGDRRRDYVHIVDGGVADNIGLREPLTALSTTDHSWSVLSMLNQEKIERILLVVVNAATSPDQERDSDPEVPGIFDTVSTAAGLPIDNYTADTLDLLKSRVNAFNQDARLLSGCKRLSAARGEQCELDIPEPYQVEFYAAEVAFDYLGSTEERHKFKNLPTTFELPRETIDELRAVGRKLLREDPEFTRFLGETEGCISATPNPC